MAARKTKVVHDAVVDGHTGTTPCCGQDPRLLLADTFSEDHAEVTCPGSPTPGGDAA